MYLFDSELNVMQVLWQEGDIKASQVCKILEKKIGWNKNTTYTIIKKCIQKGYIERKEPDFICKVILSKKEAQKQGIFDLLQRLFDNSKGEFLQVFLENEKLPKEALQQLQQWLSDNK